eukprot:GILK01008491.1.p1 GENE.GILK01008491.1~~GILK01008491.1.p1  ORF type:complete len:1462 (+),score=358.65 GILK01008491.1:105-4388(+)
MTAFRYAPALVICAIAVYFLVPTCPKCECPALAISDDVTSTVDPPSGHVERQSSLTSSTEFEPTDNKDSSLHKQRSSCPEPQKQSLLSWVVDVNRIRFELGFIGGCVFTIAAEVALFYYCVMRVGDNLIARRTQEDIEDEKRCEAEAAEKERQDAEALLVSDLSPTSDYQPVTDMILTDPTKEDTATDNSEMDRKSLQVEFEAACNRTVLTKKSLQAMSTFLSQRVQAEEAYSKAVSRLFRSGYIGGKEPLIWRDRANGWQAVKTGLDQLSKLHSDYAEYLSTGVCGTVNHVSADQSARYAKLKAEGESQIKELANAKQNVARVKQRYDLKYKEALAAADQYHSAIRGGKAGTMSIRLEMKMKLARQEADTMTAQVSDAVDRLAEQQMIHDNALKDVIREFQSLEQQRVETFRTSLRGLLSVEENLVQDGHTVLKLMDPAGKFRQNSLEDIQGDSQDGSVPIRRRSSSDEACSPTNRGGGKVATWLNYDRYQQLEVEFYQLAQQSKLHVMLLKDLYDFIQGRSDTEDAYSKQLLKIADTALVDLDVDKKTLGRGWKELQAGLKRIAELHMELCETLRAVAGPYNRNVNLAGEQSKILKANVNAGQSLIKEMSNTIAVHTKALARHKKLCKELEGLKRDVNRSEKTVTDKTEQVHLAMDALAAASTVLEQQKEKFEVAMGDLISQFKSMHRQVKAEWADTKKDIIDSQSTLFNMIRDTLRNTTQAVEAIDKYEDTADFSEFIEDSSIHAIDIASKDHTDVTPDTKYRYHMEPVENGFEKATWIHFYLKTLLTEWQSSYPFQVYMRRYFHRIYNKTRPAFLSEILVEEINCGLQAPDIRSVTRLKTDSPLEFCCELDVSYRGAFVVVMSFEVWINWPKKHSASVPVKLKITIKTLTGRLRVLLRPHDMGESWYAFVGEPVIKWDLEPVIGEHTQIKNIPQLSAMLVDKISKSFSKLVLPNRRLMKLPYNRGMAVLADGRIVSADAVHFYQSYIVTPDGKATKPTADASTNTEEDNMSSAASHKRDSAAGSTTSSLSGSLVESVPISNPASDPPSPSSASVSSSLNSSLNSSLLGSPINLASFRKEFSFGHSDSVVDLPTGSVLYREASVGSSIGSSLGSSRPGDDGDASVRSQASSTQVNFSPILPLGDKSLPKFSPTPSQVESGHPILHNNRRLSAVSESGEDREVAEKTSHLIGQIKHVVSPCRSSNRSPLFNADLTGDLDEFDITDDEGEIQPKSTKKPSILNMVQHQELVDQLMSERTLSMASRIQHAYRMHRFRQLNGTDVDPTTVISTSKRLDVTKRLFSVSSLNGLPLRAQSILKRIMARKIQRTFRRYYARIASDRSPCLPVSLEGATRLIQRRHSSAPLQRAGLLDPPSDVEKSEVGRFSTPPPVATRSITVASTPPTAKQSWEKIGRKFSEFFKKKSDH